MRNVALARTTSETNVELTIELDGTGANDIRTGISFFDHMLAQWCFYSRSNLTVVARSLDGIAHHLVEDVAMVLGEAISLTLEDRRGIARYGVAIIPMDESLARVAMDFSGRPFAYVAIGTSDERIEDMETAMVAHFFQSLAQTARASIHADVLRSANAHHGVEALFKAAGFAFAAAWQRDTRADNTIRSTKGTLT